MSSIPIVVGKQCFIYLKEYEEDKQYLTNPEKLVETRCFYRVSNYLPNPAVL
jgi:hypothetical protein